MAFLACLWVDRVLSPLPPGDWCLASVYTGRGAKMIPWDFPARVPKNNGCSAEKCRLFW